MNLFVNEKNNANIAKAQRFEPVDHVPVHFSDQLDFIGGWLDIDRQKYHLNAEVMLNAQIEFNKRFCGTGILGPNFGVCMEPSAFGAEIRFTKENPPWVIEACHNYDDMEDYVSNLKDPDPVFGGYLPLLYQNFFFMEKMTGGAISAPLGAIAAIDVASLLVGAENLCLAIKLNPDVVHVLMKKVNKFIINFMETKARIFGVSSFEIIDLYGDNAGLMSRDDFIEFVLPYNKMVYEYFRNDKSVCLYHCDGALEHLVDLIPEMGVNCLYSFDAHTDLKKVVDLIGDRVCLIGNMDPIRVLRNGTIREVEEETKRLLEIGKKARGFILSTGGETANGTPPENIDALLATVGIFGTY